MPPTLAQRESASLAVGGGVPTGDQSNGVVFASGSDMPRTLADWMADTLNVKTFGAVGDGVTDDTTAIKSAVALARSASKPLFFPPGRYRATGTLTQAGQTGPLEVYGPGATILHDFAAVIGPALFQEGDGSVGASVTVTASISAGDTQITVASTTGMSAGSFFALRDRATPHYGTNTDEINGVEGEVLRIQSVDDATHITVCGAVEENYALVDNATWTNDNVDVRVLTLVAGINIHDISFEDVSSEGENVARVFQMSRLYRPRFDNVNMKGFSSDGIRTAFAIDFLFSRVHFEDFAFDGGYGFHFQQGCCGIVDRCTARTVRHLVTTGGTITDVPPRNIDVINCQAYGQTAAAFDTHANGKNIRFINCSDHSHGPYAPSDGDASFQIRCKNASVINPRVTGGGHGVGVSVQAGAVNFILRGGDIRGCDVSVYLRRCENPSVRGVTIYPKPGATDAVLVERLSTYNVPMDHCDIGDLEIIGNASSPTTNGVRFTTNTWQSGFNAVEGIRSRNVTNPIVGNS